MTKHPSSIRAVCVYCGSSSGNTAVFAEAAHGLGVALAENGLTLVYGGGDSGLMGTVARAAARAGGRVTGIIPEFLLHQEQPDGAAGLEGVEMITVPDMHTRKQLMFEKADAFIALPGGIGTLEELVERSTWAQLGRHSKPVILLNIEEFWSPYAQLVDHMAEAGFLHNPERARPVMLETVDQVVPALLALPSLS